MQSTMPSIQAQAVLPTDLSDALLVGRVWRNSKINGPCVVVVRRGEVFDITATAPTSADLLDADDLLALARHAPGESLGSVADLVRDALDPFSDKRLPRLLAPCDVQPIKACGVTFAVSMLERVIEEKAAGDASRAESLRKELQASIGTDLSAIRPGISTTPPPRMASRRRPPATSTRRRPTSSA